MIYYFTPYSKNGLWEAYNQYISLLQDNDWAVIMDGDSMLLGEKWGKQIEEFVEKYNNAGLITCLTNRSGYVTAQGYNKQMSSISDVKYWRRVAKQLEVKDYLKCTKLDIIVTGFFMIINKKVWDLYIKKDIELNGNLGIDDYISRCILDAKLPIYRMDGLLVFHYYRLLEGINYIKHLQ